MSELRKVRINKLLSISVILFAFVFLAGWIFDINYLKNLFNNGATIKFSTCILFILSGVISYIVCNGDKPRMPDWKYHTLSAATFINWFYCLGLLFSINRELSFPSGTINDLPHELTVSDSVPSLGSILCFILMGFSGFSYLVSKKNKSKYLFFIGANLIMLGITVLIGFLLNNPLLYYFSPSKSSAMSIPSAVMFILLGISTHISSRQEKRKHLLIN